MPACQASILVTLAVSAVCSTDVGPRVGEGNRQGSQPNCEIKLTLTAAMHSFRFVARWNKCPEQGYSYLQCAGLACAATSVTCIRFDSVNGPSDSSEGRQIISCRDNKCCLHAFGLFVSAAESKSSHTFQLLSCAEVLATTPLAPLSIVYNGQICHKETTGQLCCC